MSVFCPHSSCVWLSIYRASPLHSRSEVITAMLLKSDVFRDVTPWRWANRFRRFGRSCCVHLQGQAVLDCITIIRNVTNDSPKDTTSHPVRLESSSLFPFASLRTSQHGIAGAMWRISTTAISNRSAAFRRPSLLPSSVNFVLDVNTAAVVSDFCSKLTCLVNVRTQANILREERERRNLKVKVNFTLEQATKAQRGVEVYPYSFLNLALNGMGV